VFVVGSFKGEEISCAVIEKNWSITEVELESIYFYWVDICHAAHNVISMPESVVSGEDDDNVVTHLSWEEQMELDYAKLDADKEGKSAKLPMGKKLKVEESTKHFLQEVFALMDNDDSKDLHSKFIVLDTPHLDKVMAAECSKSVKYADHSSHVFRHSSWMQLVLSQASWIALTRMKLLWRTWRQ